MVVMGQLTTQWGVHVFLVNRKIDSYLHYILGFGFFTVWGILEIRHQAYLKSHVAYDEPT